MKIELIARSRLGGEFVSRVDDGPLRRHWLYRDREPVNVTESEVKEDLNTGELQPDGNIFDGWGALDVYILENVQKTHTTLTELPPSVALARASIRFLSGLQQTDSSLPVIADLIAHLLQSSSVVSDEKVRRQLLAFLQRPTPRSSRPQPVRASDRYQVSASYFNADQPQAA